MIGWAGWFLGCVVLYFGNSEVGGIMCRSNMVIEGVVMVCMVVSVGS